MMKPTIQMAVAGLILLGGCVPADRHHTEPDQPPVASRESAPRKAAVVLPLLAKYTATDGLTYVEKVMGRSDLDCGSAIHDLWYRLDDGSSVRVRATLSGEVLSIERQGKDVAGNEIIYEAEKRRQSTNHTSDGIPQPADGSRKPSR